ncbi:LPS export ABC transporter periplasmic protein LptC [bacterium]|nr:MAG: LPS export ABC transporter periplasmic protein LptC [bacterium]
MTFRRSILLISLITLFIPAFCIAEQKAGESDQQINDFSLAGYAEKGKKSWDLSGKSADIFTEVVKLQDVVGNLYGEKEDIKLTANRGDFNKNNGRVRLEEQVVITTSSGAKLTTDSLDWDRKNQLVSTKELVNISKENMVTTAQGAIGQPDLNKVVLQKDVKVDINPDSQSKQAKGIKNKVTITCDGPLEIDYQNNVATFKNNVKVDNLESLIFSDVMDVYFVRSGKGDHLPEAEARALGANIEKIIARGNVKIMRGSNVSYSEEAVYSALDKKIILRGQPRLIVYSAEDLNASFGNQKPL